jgi:hypothetical protein
MVNGSEACERECECVSVIKRDGRKVVACARRKRLENARVVGSSSVFFFFFSFFFPFFPPSSLSEGK